MIKIPRNFTVREAEPVKSDSQLSAYPVKVMTGYYRVPSSELSAGEQAKRFVDSFSGTEIMFDIILIANMRVRLVGHMYHDGTYGEFILMFHGGIDFYSKLDGVWSVKSL